ncbi:Uu.00g085280.m01.CDS01 [Anthostomella pinea]|uniref:Uu.00g085280.m01.CDS01 n=1 Tax=Anthostomella pinea TaxID=933095 RepID=A0AAI8VMJ4_9PEZI|nr:Uu.00g085280.m01.CDS01 [Anthostomella pinea]
MSFTSALWRRQVLSLTSSTSALPRTTQPTSPLSRHLLRARNQRFQSTDPNPSKPPPNNSSSSTSSSSSSATAEAAARKQHSRLNTILHRAQRWLPAHLHPTFARLRSAPLSHVGAFLVLHEITAIGPLFGLTYLFYTMDWVPTAWVLGPWAEWAEEGLQKYARWFRRKGWYGLGRGAKGGEDGDGRGSGDGRDGREGEERLEGELKGEIEREKREGRGTGWVKGWMTRFRGKGKEDAESVGAGVVAAEGADEGRKMARTAWQKVKKAVTFDNTERGYKVGIQIAAAYTITKMLLVPRIALSLWLTPWLARGFVGFRRTIFKKRWGT